MPGCDQFVELALPPREPPRHRIRSAARRRDEQRLTRQPRCPQRPPRHPRIHQHSYWVAVSEQQPRHRIPAHLVMCELRHRTERVVLGRAQQPVLPQPLQSTRIQRGCGIELIATDLQHVTSELQHHKVAGVRTAPVARALPANQALPDLLHRVEVADRHALHPATHQQIDHHRTPQQLTRLRIRRHRLKLNELADHQVDLRVRHRRHRHLDHAFTDPPRHRVHDQLLRIARRHHHNPHLSRNSGVHHERQQVLRTLCDRIRPIHYQHPGRGGHLRQQIPQPRTQRRLKLHRRRRQVSQVQTHDLRLTSGRRFRPRCCHRVRREVRLRPQVERHR